jgi:xanthine dehydrogenase iron-sulfur cluster and FAD-binding subunit A
VLAKNAAAVLATSGDVAAAQAALVKEIAPIDDVRSTAEYRAVVAANLLAQFWDETK